ncbi:MAG: hypothetical protein CI948_2792 [Halanaerobium sp.]|jgi:REP element-mobilizing transposase RayT|nr:MAG: hypothetical protein CI948_2792 [Halanaerobium sp.]
MEGDINMPRKNRVWYPGAIYHIVSRGNRQGHLFRDNRDYTFYLEILKKIKEECNYSLLSYCLMTNHIHLQIKTEKDPIWKIMHRINLFYARYFNYKYDLKGHVFQGRYHSKVIEDDFYNIGVSRYIHLNPVEASIVENADEYNRSSYPIYLAQKDSELVETDHILNFFENNCNLYKKFVESNEINKELDKEIKLEIDL